MEFPITLITLTYGREFPGAQRAKRNLFTFCKRVERWWSGTSAIWRLEFQQRGAPHFHLIYFGPYLDKGLLQKWWGEVIGQERPFTRIEALRNWRHGLAYAAKYLAKVPEGRPKGAEADGTAAGGGGDAPAGGLDYLTYLTAGESVGRVWGVLERRNLPWGETQAFPLTPGRWVHRWKRAARKRWRGVNTWRHAGACLFVDNPAPWLYLAAVEGAAGGSTPQGGVGGGQEEVWSAQAGSVSPDDRRGFCHD